MKTCLAVDHADGVTHVRLERAEERNTLVPAFWSELRAVAEEADADGRTRVLLISSTGRHFSAGLDRAILGTGMFGEPHTEPGRARSQVYAGIRSLQRAFSALAESRVPAIAAIQGGCVGGAVGLAAACDLRYASADAFFLLQEANLGLTPDVGQLQRLARQLPDAVLREMAYRGHRLGAARAAEVGFVNEVHADHESLLWAAWAVAREIAAQSPLAMWGAKAGIGYAQEHTVADGLDQAALWQAAMYHRTDAIESLAALREGRSAEYDDLPPAPRGSGGVPA